MDEAMRRLMLLHWQPPAGGLLPGVRRGHAQPRHLAAAGHGSATAKIEVSAMYYDYKFKQLPPYQQQATTEIDLRFAT